MDKSFLKYELVFRRKDRKLFKIPVAAAALLGVFGMKKPGYLALGIGGLMLSDIKVNLLRNGREERLIDAVKNAAQETGDRMFDSKAELKMKYSNMKENGIINEFKENGDKYFTIKL